MYLQASERFHEDHLVMPAPKHPPHWNSDGGTVIRRTNGEHRTELQVKTGVVVKDKEPIQQHLIVTPLFSKAFFETFEASPGMGKLRSLTHQICAVQGSSMAAAVSAVTAASSVVQSHKTPARVPCAPVVIGPRGAFCILADHSSERCGEWPAPVLLQRSAPRVATMSGNVPAAAAWRLQWCHMPRARARLQAKQEMSRSSQTSGGGGGGGGQSVTHVSRQCWYV